MANGVRRNVAKISQAERDKLRDAIVALDGMTYPDGVSFWDKQDAIHQATHVHGGPAFVPWHRELCNRFEALLRQVDPTVSLHYWDWTTDPRQSPDGAGGFTDLFTSAFMGSASGRAGAPLDTLDNNGVFAGSRDDTGNPADPPQEISRSVAPGAPGIPADATIVGAGNGLPQDEQWQAFRTAVEGAHNTSHGYIGGTIGNPHSAFEDPFVFLLHSNVDRLWASWQRAPGQAWRLDPNQVYGNESADPAILENMEPWAGLSGLRPWAPPDNEQLSKTSRNPTIVAPPEYDDYATRPVEPAPTACVDSCLSVTVRDSHHPCAPYQSTGHSFLVEIYHCDGLPLFWRGIDYGKGVLLQVAGAGGGMIHGKFPVPPGCYLIRAAAPCHNVVTDWAWVNVGCSAKVCVDLVPPMVRHCIRRALTGIALGTAEGDKTVRDVAPREARSATNALDKLAAKLPEDPLPPPPAP
jgi:tyrosinase-like protein